MAQIKFNTSGAIRIVTRSSQEGIHEIMKEVLARAVADAPVLTEDLRKSAKINFNKSSTSISFNTPYAAIQHENLSYRHPRGGKAKYLEDAFNEIVPGAVRNKLPRKMKKALGGSK